MRIRKGITPIRFFPALRMRTNLFRSTGGRRPPPALRAVWMIRKIFAGAVFMPTAGSAIYARPYRKAIWIYLFNPLF